MGEIAAVPVAARRSDAGLVRLGARDITGLVLAGEMYGAPYDLLARALGVTDARLRATVGRWRRAGFAASGRLGPGPAWCWLTREGMTATGLFFPATQPALGRLAHIRAVLAVRLQLQSSQAWRDGAAWWRSERRIRAAIGGRVGAGHLPDAEVSWPDTGGRYAGEVWAVEAEVTPKPLRRTVRIMTGLLERTAGYGPRAAPGDGPRYARVVYLVSPQARPVAERAAASLPVAVRGRVAVRDLPPGAML